MVLADVISGFARLELASRRHEHRAEAAERSAASERFDAYFRTRHGRSAAECVLALTMGADPSDLSLRHLLDFVRSSGGFRWLTAFRGGAQQDVLPGGMQQVAELLASRAGDVICRDQPVERIVQAPDRVRIVTADGDLTALRCIVAVPPPLAGRIDFEPALPPARRLLHEQTAMGAYAKMFALYERPLWREAGLSGLGMSLASPFQMTIDAGAKNAAVLVGFAGGRGARELASLDRRGRERATTDHVRRMFAIPKPDLHAEVLWSNEPYVWGAPVMLRPPGTGAAVAGAVRAPVGRIHWAGSETATAYPGFMEGAVEAGERAAAEALATI